MEKTSVPYPPGLPSRSILSSYESPALEELTTVLTYLRLRVVARHPDLPQILRWLHAPERIVFPRRAIETVKVDPSDNRVLEVAVEGHAEAVISGDDHLLRLRIFEGIPILSAASFCRRWNV